MWPEEKLTRRCAELRARNEWRRRCERARTSGELERELALMFWRRTLEYAARRIRLLELLAGGGRSGVQRDES